MAASLKLTAYSVAVSLRPLLSFAWRMLLTLTLFRTALVVWQWQRVADADMLVPIFVQGLRFDLVSLGVLSLIPVLLYPIFSSNRFLAPAWRRLLRVYFSAALLVVVFMECSTPSFVDQFDSRPNLFFFEYLNHPGEIAGTLWAAYKFPMFAALLLVSAMTWANSRQIGRLVDQVRPVGMVPALVVTALLFVVCVGMARSTLDHRPVNPSTVSLSTDPLVNELALNSTYTALYALYETRHETEGGFRYGRMDEDSAISTVRNQMLVSPDSFTSQEIPTLHIQSPPPKFPDTPRNLVIIVEESLGAEFVGSLGGLDLTPNLDALAGDGIWFRNLYATGTRSARGLEAIVSGFTPTPARSIVNLNKSQRGFFTLAELLRQFGYKSSFIYGGEAQFDNMRRFFMNNGFDSVVDKRDYPHPVFTGSWGVSDEDLFDRAQAEFSAPHNGPFFSLVFTSSNHTPFEFPDGRIELYDPEKHTVNNAVKYADYALGHFIGMARESSYWDDTVFLIVADHNSRMYGNELVPIDRFHIPALILGGAVRPMVFDPVASQIDLAPTLLSLIGISSEHPMIGHDLTEHDSRLSPGRAIMQFNATQAYLEGDRVAILQKDQPIRHFRYKNGRLVADDSESGDLDRIALAHATWSSVAYERSLYRLPETPVSRRSGYNHEEALSPSAT